MTRPGTRIRLTLAILSLSLAWAAGPALADHGSGDRAGEVVERLDTALGGHEAWEGTRFIRFNFFGNRLHHWDRATGRHRLEGESREGESYVVLHNVIDRTGAVYVDGERLEGEAAAEWLERAYGAWINDTYWLLMPYKLRDPGVNLSYGGEEEIDGTLYDKLEVSFESVGLTPGDRYWAWINRDTGLMDQWAYHLEDWEEERPATVWQWLDWKRYGGVMLSSRRYDPAADREAKLDEIAVFETLADEVFTQP